jgi:hypothetical protein
MKKVCYIALAVVMIAGSAICQDDTKGRVNIPRPGTSDVKGPVQSATKVSVPNVVGKTLAEAITTLDSAGFIVKATGSGNTIKSQNPAANTKVAPGTTVNITR